MAWGKTKRGIDDIIRRVTEDRDDFTAIYVMPQRTMKEVDVQRLAAALAENAHLREIYAGGHKIGTKGAAAFARALKKNRTLKRICIGSADFGDEAFLALCKGLRENEGLAHLDLENRSLGPSSGKALGDVLVRSSDKSTLETLLLARNALGSLGSASLLESVASTSRVRTVDLSANDVCVKDCPTFAKALESLAKSDTCTLTELRMGNNPSLSIRSWTNLLSIRSLRKLDLSNTGIGDAEAETLFEAIFDRRARLEELDVSDNHISPVGFAAAAKVLRAMSLRDRGDASESTKMDAASSGARLATLSVAGNHVGAATKDLAQSFVAAARSGVFERGLSELNLHRCRLDRETAAAFVRVPVTRLNLSQNALGDVGSRTIAAELRMSTIASALRELDLCNNKITMAGATALCDAVVEGKNRTMIETLVLGGNRLGLQGREAALACMRACSTLKIIFGDKPIDDDDDDVATSSEEDEEEEEEASAAADRRAD